MRRGKEILRQAETKSSSILTHPERNVRVFLSRKEKIISRSKSLWEKKIPTSKSEHIIKAKDQPLK